MAVRGFDLQIVEGHVTAPNANSHAERPVQYGLGAETGACILRAGDSDLKASIDCESRSSCSSCNSCHSCHQAGLAVGVPPLLSVVSVQLPPLILAMNYLSAEQAQGFKPPIL